MGLSWKFSKELAKVENWDVIGLGVVGFGFGGLRA